jgi:hypothetical protein
VNQGAFLNLTNAFTSPQSYFGNSVTSSSFSLNSANVVVNQSGATYVAYLFAHDAGGFGTTGSDNVISCGSYAGNNGLQTVSLGYEAQWVLIKNASDVYNWSIYDNMRGMAVGAVNNPVLYPNTTAAEAADRPVYPTSTGFAVNTAANIVNATGNTYIYIAIRRGPMKTPTTGTSVFQPVAYTGTNVDNRLVNTGIVTDMAMARIRTATSTGGFYTADRLRGNASLGTAIGDAENTDADSFMTPTVGYGNSFSAMNGFGVGNDVTRQLNQSSTSQLAYAFQRAPSFFDEVCYTGNGTARTISHNLGVVPELMIVKSRSSTTDWSVYLDSVWESVNRNYLRLNLSAGAGNGNGDLFPSQPTSSLFSVSDNGEVNNSGTTYVAYLFATCAGVSKVGSYTGNGSSQTINCGFTGGARFVMVKATSTTGNWIVADSARGIVAGNDPALYLNSTAAEVTGLDWIDADNSGFVVNETATIAANTNGVSYIFLAIS